MATETVDKGLGINSNKTVHFLVGLKIVTPVENLLLNLICFSPSYTDFKFKGHVLFRKFILTHFPTCLSVKVTSCISKTCRFKNQA